MGDALHTRRPHVFKRLRIEDPAAESGDERGFRSWVVKEMKGQGYQIVKSYIKVNTVRVVKRKLLTLDSVVCCW